MAKSPECQVCHQQAHQVWQASHHALAHRKVGRVEDSWAFLDRSLTAGKAEWKFSGGVKTPLIEWRDTGSGAKPISLAPPMVIGHRPLIQYVMDFGNGRYQVPDASWDPVKQEWFSMFGADQRSPHEWGNWTQRGMNWNSQCAYCHFTQFRKNYDDESDGYRTTWLEQGVGCAQCHGPNRAERASNECMVDPKQKFTPKQWMHSCATCHARREEFDEKFQIGDDFYDHYNLALPSQPGLYHPDGQQIDEDYNTTSLLLSRMGHKGISCIDCHDWHAATPKGGQPAVQSDALCLQCHATGLREAKVIDPAAHSFHKPGTKGSRCVECHMPKTAYMARDPRSDHRFPSPDPLLTKELGIPNACNDCHADKGLDWQIEWTDKWYGARDRPHDRERTRAVAAALRNEPDVLPKLLGAYDQEDNAAWLATLIRLMAPWTGDGRVLERANRSAGHADPLVRAAAASLLGRWPQSGDAWTRLTRDPVRAVRLEAGWAGVERLPPTDGLLEEMNQVAIHQSDQPGGRMRLAQLAIRRGDPAAAEGHMRRAAAWDQGSYAPLRDLAVLMAENGKPREAVAALEEAAKRAPADAQIPYLTALALAELGDQQGTEAKLRQAIKLDPRFSRAYYNLGLLLSAQGQLEAAIISLRNASDTEPADPGPPYALATIYLRLGQPAAAETAAREALRRNPGHQQATELLQSLKR
ncbi:MAG: tetratricopeptide repeat protein [Akkermansiaceae bacterium]|nr:tetratricopeptide repeat protein [Akkermansiaceae bacterium]